MLHTYRTRNFDDFYTYILILYADNQHHSTYVTAINVDYLLIHTAVNATMFYYL